MQKYRYRYSRTCERPLRRRNEEIVLCIGSFDRSTAHVLRRANFRSRFFHGTPSRLSSQRFDAWVKISNEAFLHIIPYRWQLFINCPLARSNVATTLSARVRLTRRIFHPPVVGGLGRFVTKKIKSTFQKFLHPCVLLKWKKCWIEFFWKFSKTTAFIKIYNLLKNSLIVRQSRFYMPTKYLRITILTRRDFLKKSLFENVNLAFFRNGTVSRKNARRLWSHTWFNYCQKICTGPKDPVCQLRVYKNLSNFSIFQNAT